MAFVLALLPWKSPMIHYRSEVQERSVANSVACVAMSVY